MPRLTANEAKISEIYKLSAVLNGLCGIASILIALYSYNQDENSLFLRFAKETLPSIVAAVWSSYRLADNHSDEADKLKKQSQAIVPLTALFSYRGLLNNLELPSQLLYTAVAIFIIFKTEQIAKQENEPNQQPAPRLRR